MHCVTSGLRFSLAGIALLLLLFGQQALAVEKDGTLVLDVGSETVTYSPEDGGMDQVEEFAPLGNSSNRCQIDQRDLTLLALSGDAEAALDVAISRQRGSWGLEGSGQGCGFIESQNEATMSLGEAFFTADVIGYRMTFIVTDDAVFDLVFIDQGGNAVRTVHVYTGRSEQACPGGTPRTDLTGDEVLFFACVAQSNPNSSFNVDLFKGQTDEDDTFDESGGDYAFYSMEVVVHEGDVGMTNATWDLAEVLQPTGVLTCEQDTLSNAATITEQANFFEDTDPLFRAGAAVCRRGPNRPVLVNGVPVNSQCEPVPYVIDATCEESNSSDCSVTFLHGDQIVDGSPLPRDAYAFFCEVWWPARPGNFSADFPPDAGEPEEPVLRATEVYWGGLDTPEVRGVVDANFCPGVTPIFSEQCSPLEFLLSSEEVGKPPLDGLTVTTPSSTCSRSLLGAYEDVLLPAPTVADDQCPATQEGCPDGIQRICLIGRHDFQVQDPDVEQNDPTNGRFGNEEGGSSLYQRGERYVIEGDIRLRSF